MKEVKLRIKSESEVSPFDLNLLKKFLWRNNKIAVAVGLLLGMRIYKFCIL